MVVRRVFANSRRRRTRRREALLAGDAVELAERLGVVAPSERVSPPKFSLGPGTIARTGAGLGGDRQRRDEARDVMRRFGRLDRLGGVTPGLVVTALAQPEAGQRG